MLSGVTDWLDGYLARRLNQTSQLGQILDPVADRLYILAVVIGLALREIIPWWVAVILPLRDLLLWGLVPLLRTRGYSALPVHFLGKAATFNLLYAFPLLLLGDGEGVVATLAKVFGWAFAWWGIGLYWWAGILYAYQVFKLLRTTERWQPQPTDGRHSDVSRDVAGRTAAMPRTTTRQTATASPNDTPPDTPRPDVPDEVMMPLLDRIVQQSLDEDYRVVAARKQRTGGVDRRAARAGTGPGHAARSVGRVRSRPS